MERPAFGIAELVAYPDGYVETDLFPKRTPADFGSTCDLIDTFGFYDVYNSIFSKTLGAVNVEDGYYDGTTEKESFTVGYKTYNKGILLRTSIYLDGDFLSLLLRVRVKRTNPRLLWRISRTAVIPRSRLP